MERLEYAEIINIRAQAFYLVLHWIQRLQTAYIVDSISLFLLIPKFANSRECINYRATLLLR